MRHLLLTVATVTTLVFASPATAQGVPTFDGSQLGQLVAQLEHMAEDLNVQMQQLATMRLELETQLSQLTNLEAQLTSLIEGSGLGELFATVEEFRALRGKLGGPHGSTAIERNLRSSARVAASTTPSWPALTPWAASSRQIWVRMIPSSAVTRVLRSTADFSPS